MATVYFATDTRLQRTVALKVLRPDLAADTDFMERFRREALATAALSHPNVVAVFDFDHEDGVAYLVLEYVPGHTLRHLLAQHRLTPSQALAVLEPILDALVSAHDAGIVHRDIKPENVLLGPRGSVKVADFGLARALDDGEHRTKTGLVIGTAAYVSPEHIAGTGTGAPSDVYSAGILLFELLTGTPPYAGDNALSVAYQHVNSDVPRPSDQVAGTCPTEVDDLVLGATAKDLTARFGSAAEFLAELRPRAGAHAAGCSRCPNRSGDTGATLVLAGDPAVRTTMRSRSADPDEADDSPHRRTPPRRSRAKPGSHRLRWQSGDAEAPDGKDPDGSPRKRRRGRIVLLSAAAATPSSGAPSWAFLAGPLQRATVPDLVGLAQSDATAVLDEAGLRLEVADEQYSETAPRDTVISHDPAAHSGTFIRFPVSAVVSLGPERYGVPDLRGQTVAEASATLQGTKLAVAGQQTAFDEEIEKGLVAGTDPPTGTSLKPQTEVTLIVSEGPPPRPVPDVLGQPRAEAVAALEALGLAADIDEAFNEQYPAGQVAAVAPKAGTEVAKGSTVALTISKGPPPVEVPRVVDMKRDDAVAKLRAAGFQVRLQEGIVTPLNRVYSQDPPPGELRPKGSTVTISIF